MLRGRLQLAESGQWHELLHAYLADVAAADRIDRSRYDRSAARALPIQPLTDTEIFTKAATKAAGHALKSASDLLLGATRAALTEATAVAVDFLVAEAVPDAEVQDKRREACLAGRRSRLTCVCGTGRRYRRRLRVVKLAAQPGPSGWRISHLVAVSAISGGVAAVARWGELWQRGLLAPGTIRLWTAACVSPTDCGERPLEPGEPADAPRRRKLRPTACAECPLKLVEGAAIDAVIAEVAPAFGPAQLGCGAADGAGVMVSLLRIRAEEELEPRTSFPRTRSSSLGWIWRTPTGGRIGLRASAAEGGGRPRSRFWGLPRSGAAPPSRHGNVPTARGARRRRAVAGGRAAGSCR